MSDTSDAEAPRTVEAVLDRVDRAWAPLAAEIERLDERQLGLAGADGWTVKDHLAHLAVWEQSLLALLERRPRFEAMGVDRSIVESGGVDAVNDVLVARYRDRPAAEVVADVKATHARLREVIAGLQDDDLTRPYAEFQPDDPRRRSDPVIGWIAGDTYEHYGEHLDWIRRILDRARSA